MLYLPFRDKKCPSRHSHSVYLAIYFLSIHGSLHGVDGPELYVDLLLKNRTPYVTTQVSAHSAKRKIAEFSQTPVDFLQKYDELKSKKWVCDWIYKW